MTGLVEVKDHVTWLKHIRNDDELVTYLDNFKQGVVINLSVDNKIGTWEKMADKNGRRSKGGFDERHKADRGS